MQIAVHIIKDFLLKLYFITTTILLMYQDGKNKLSFSSHAPNVAISPVAL